MKTIRENEISKEAQTLSDVIGENVSTSEQKRYKGHILHLVLGGILVILTLLLKIPYITYALCTAYVISGVWLLNRSITG